MVAHKDLQQRQRIPAPSTALGMPSLIREDFVRIVLVGRLGQIVRGLGALARFLLPTAASKHHNLIRGKAGMSLKPEPESPGDIAEARIQAGCASKRGD